MQSQFAAAAECIAVDRSNQRRTDVPDSFPGFKTADHHFNRRFIGHLFNICSGGKGFLAGACDDDTANCLIAIKLLQRVAQFAYKLEIKCVQLLWSIQRHKANTLISLDEDILILCHDAPLHLCLLLSGCLYCMLNGTWDTSLLSTHLASRT